MGAHRPKLNMYDPDVKHRKCLRCLMYFISSWAGNRICLKCKPVVEREDNGALSEHEIKGIGERHE